METRRQRDMETRRHGDMETRRYGDTETRRHGEMEIWVHGDMETWTWKQSWKRKFVVFPFVDEETNGSYPLANRLNGLNGLNGLGHLRATQITGRQLKGQGPAVTTQTTEETAQEIAPSCGNTNN
jgi:hypothetical protein